MSKLDPVTVTPQVLSEVLLSSLRAGRAVAIESKPGQGKTEIVYQVGDTLDWPVHLFRAALREPTDLSGFPAPDPENAGFYRMLRPGDLPRTRGPGIFFMDELNRAPLMTQNACMHYALRDSHDGHALPEGWVAVCAVNPVDRGVQQSPRALEERFKWVRLETDLGDWRKWASGAGINPYVIAFLSNAAQHLTGDPERPEDTYPSPRDWAFCSDTLNELETRPVSPGVELALLAGDIGRARALELMAFLAMARRVSLDAILLNPDTAMVPDPAETGLIWSIACGLVNRASVSNFDRVLTYLGRLPGEFSTYAVKAARGRDPELMNTNAAISWAADHAYLL